MKTRIVMFLAKKGGYSIPWVAPVLIGAEVAILATAYWKGKKNKDK